MSMRELERTFLVKNLPDMDGCKSREVTDIYVPASAAHPTLRIRRNGPVFEMTKKEPVVQGDSSHQDEQTIRLSEEEFRALASLPGKRVSKMRYPFIHQGRTAEIDVFQGSLKGLVLIDFEFETVEEKDAFRMPEFCLADVTQETFLAGGMLCGKSYADIEHELKKFGYKKV